MKEEKSNIADILVTRYLSGEATHDETKQLKQWLESDKQNQRYFNQLRNIWQATNPTFKPNEINTEEAYQKVTGKLQLNRKQHKLITWFSRVAAVLILPLLIATTYALLKTSPQADVVYQEIHAPYGTYSEVVLPDGSKVSINAGSKLRFPSVFTKGKREVYLDGEGYFEVVSSKENPFLVYTEKFTVKATGTKFNVEDYSKDTIAAVTMIEGIVNTTITNDKTLPLNPGNRILFSKTSNQLQQLQTDPYKWYAWKDGTLIFRDDPLGYVFKRLSQTFNVNIIMKDTQLATHPYRATFTNESLEEIMRLLKISAPIQFRDIDREFMNEEFRDKRTIEVYSTKHI